MKKHLRLYAIILTSFFLVGIMAAAAAAGDIVLSTHGIVNVNNAQSSAAGSATNPTEVSGLKVGEKWYIGLKATGVTSQVIEGTSASATVTGTSLDISGNSTGKTTFRLFNQAKTESIDLAVTVVANSGTVYFGNPSGTKDIGEHWDATDKAFIGGTEVKSQEFWTAVSLDLVVSFDRAVKRGTSGLPKLEVKFTPSGSGLEFTQEKWSTDSEGGTASIRGYLSGTVAKLKKDTEYTLDLTATDGSGQGTAKKTVKFKVWAYPEIKDAKPSTITWGDKSKGWSFTPSGNDGVQSWDIAKANEVSGSDYLMKTSLDNDAFTFSNRTGELKADSNGWRPGVKSKDILNPDTWNGNDINRKIKLIAYQGEGTHKISVDKDIPLTFAGIAPAFKKDANAVTSALKDKIVWGVNITSADVITVEGPGYISFDSADLPKGVILKLSSDTALPHTDPYTWGVKFDAHAPDETAKNKKITISAWNAFNRDKPVKLSPTINIGIDEKQKKFSFDQTKGYPSKDNAVGDTVEVNFQAGPAPIKWTSKLPKGLTLTPDKDDSTKATLKGKYEVANSGAKDRRWEVTATNTDTNIGKTISGDVTIWAEPKFKTKSIKALKTGTKFEFTIEVENFPIAESYDVSIDTTGLLKHQAAFAGAPAGWSVPNGKSQISIDLAKLSADSSKIIFSGSFDRVFTNGGKIPLSITARNHAAPAGVPETYEITLTGTAPKFGKGDITFSEKQGWTKSYDVSVGDPSIDMVAKIDAKTAEKIFGYPDGEIVLGATDSGVTATAGAQGLTGLTFTPSGNKDGKSTFSFAQASKDQIAFNKLPITVTAKNAEVSDKETTGKVTITVEGEAPKLIISADLSSFKATDGESSYTQGAELGSESFKSTTVALTIDASQPLQETNILRAGGAGPFDLTVKPEEKNGIKAEVVKKDDDGNNTGYDYVKFSGTPTADAKKDVVTKFSVVAKNRSTGKQAKGDVTFTAAPKPTMSTTDISPKKAVVYGKNVKVAPKLSVTNKNVKWLLTKVSDEVYDGTEAKETVLVDKLKTTYGLVFDPKKGSVSGKTKYATGDEDGKELVIEIQASGDVSSSDVATAKIKVLGEKTKLTTKIITVKVDVQPTSDNTIETNISAISNIDSTRANVDFTGSNSSSGVPLSTFDAPEAVQNLTIENDGSLGKAKIAGTASQVTKKANVTLKMNNYGTESTGKLSIVVDGETPAINGTSISAVDAGGTGEGQVTLSNASQLSEKIKWKISEKPNTSGVSAKIKGDATGATLTIKVGKKVADSSGTFKITATDSVTKKTSSPTTIDYAINPYVPETNDALKEVASTLEAKTEPETTSEAKALGEGTVKIGAERGVGGLSAQQRAFIEDQGYIIAAVLPELEVEEASGPYEFEVDELEEAAATGAELAYFAFASKPTTDDEYVVFSDAEGESEETQVIPESRKLIAEVWLNVGTKYAPVIAVKADAADAEATSEEDVKAQAEALAEEKAAEGEATDVQPEAKEEAAE